MIDPLNVPSALKPILDALVEFGHQRGNTFKDVIVTTDQRKCGTEEDEHLKVRIEPTDIPSPPLNRIGLKRQCASIQVRTRRS